MNKIDKIFHISDIHIRNLKRHTEYKQVFQRLYSEIEQRKTEDSLIVVAGDIAHSKTEMSPELIQMIKEFFLSLSRLCDTIVITGNHDCNLNNTYRLDVLSPIIESMNLQNLFYYKDSGVYTHGNVDFVVWSIFDNEETYIRANDVEGDRKKIGLYHGPVDSARTDAGFSIFNNKVTVDMMEGYDMFLLGDIHHFQYLNDEETIAYSSSLIQQNHGENLNGHGMLVWDVDSNKSEFVEIQNDYGYYTLEVEGGKVPSVTDMPKNPRLRIKITNTDSADIKNVLTEIRKKYEVDEFTVIRTDTLSKQKVGGEGKLVYDNIQNVEHQNVLIREYVDKNYPMLDDDLVTQILDINRELNTKIPEEDVVRNIQWFPISFQFDNMFSYGEGNTIDFTNMEGVLGLFAPNTSGKSSIFDAISYCVFDKCSRAFKAEHIINNTKDWFKCKFNFQIDGVDFYIQKEAVRQKRGNVKVDIDFYKVEGGTKISLNGEHRRDTSSIIRQYLGSYEDFVFTCLSLQGNNSIFIDKSQSERKDLLAQLMGLNIFDKLYKIGNDEIKETTAVLRKFKREDFTEELAGMEVQYSDKKSILDKQEKEELGIKQKLDKFDDELEGLYQQLHSVDETLDIGKIENGMDSIQSEREVLNERIKSIIGSISNLKDEVNLLDSKLDSFENIQSEYDTWVDDKTKLNSIEAKIEKHKIQVSNTLKRLQTTKDNLNFEVNDDCKSCLNNVQKFNKEYKEILSELENQKKIATKLLEERKKYEHTLSTDIEDRYKNYTDKKLKKDTKIKELDSLESKHSVNKTNLLSLESKLEILMDKKDEYYTNEEKIKENIVTRDKINEVKKNKSNHRQKYDSVQTEIKSLLNEIAYTEQRIQTLREKIDEAKELESKIEAYEYYLDSVKRDGIPYQMISKTIPMIQNEINNILQQIVDFSMSIQVEGKNINAKLVYEDKEWPLELGSGMERFISGVAIRVALMNISNLPRPNFIVLDEGFGALDSDNFNSLFMLFQYLKSQFHFIIIISHLDSMRDIVNNFIEINKTNGYSKITH